MNPLTKLAEHGQSYWFDDLTRHALRSGELSRRVRHQGLSGVTSNPKTFSDAVLADPAYREEAARLAADGRTTEQILEALAVTDVRNACDLLRPVYDASSGNDGFVNLEVSPRFAHDSAASVAEARRLAAHVDRPNLMIKIPGTKAGLDAVQTLLAEGINVNVTLLFSVERYAEFADAYRTALERRHGEGKSFVGIRSVASFFLSRIDTLVDELLAQYASPSHVAKAKQLFGKVAVANAKLAYQRFLMDEATPRARALAQAGAAPQRLLWASTGVKNPKYDELMYVEPLIGSRTVTTMPAKTSVAFGDHGRVEATLEQGIDEARGTMSSLLALGLDFSQVATQLENEGVQKFMQAEAKLLERLEADRHRERSRHRIGPLRDVAANLRRTVIRMTTEAGSGHPTSALSSADLVAALFFHQMRYSPHDPRSRIADTFVLSKGHAAPILWAALSEAGAISEDPLTLRQLDSTLEGHPTPRNPWVRAATGSLGQGLAFANGVALAMRHDQIEARTYCLLGDGECSEGSVWEAAQFASLNRLTNLVAIVDVNGLAQSGLAPYHGDADVFARRFEAFGWKTRVFDGHDMQSILDALHFADSAGPVALLARTVKGKGVSFLEGAPGWHGKALDSKQAEAALVELGPARPQVTVTPRRAGSYEPVPAAPRRERIEISYDRGQKVATRAGFGKALAKLGGVYPELFVLDGDVKDSTRADAFAQAFPERFVQCHIAEQNMAGVALGLAKSGKLAVAATFAAFLSRAADFVRMAGHSQPDHLVFCGSHAGVSIGQDGPSQMGLEDLAWFRSILGSTVLYPADAVAAERLTEEALRTRGIVYLRTTRAETPVIYDNEAAFPVGGSRCLRSSSRDQLTIVAAGITVHEALAAASTLEQDGVWARVIDAYSVKPLDADAIRQAAGETRRVLVVEDHVVEGGLGEAVAAAVTGVAPVRQLGVLREPRSGKSDELLDLHGISARAIAAAATELLAMAQAS
jgi:transketolase